MSCASCATSIETHVSKIPGISNVTVNYATETANFNFDSDKAKKEAESKIKDLGYELAKDDEKDDQREEKQNFQKFIFSMTFALLTFLFAMGPLKGLPTPRSNWFIQLLLTTPVWIWVGFKFQKAALQFFTKRQANMNTLIGIGTSSAYIYSVFVTIFPTHSQQIGLSQQVYFEAVGFIISFVYLGQYFEDKAKKKTKEALDSLLQLGTKQATLVINDKEQKVDVDKVNVADMIRVRPGEKFPVDGKIIKGASAIDESMISGEPLPVNKSKGQKIFAGTINGEGVIDYLAQKVGRDTLLAQIIDFVENAQTHKPKIQRFADKVSAYFTLTIIFIATITFSLWFLYSPGNPWGAAVSSFIAVLVVACPCALGLATPTAVVVATGRASLKGMLIGGGEIIEKAEGMTAVVFDKTGTITQGKPSVIEYVCLNKELSKPILEDAASIESFSEHPLSKAITQYAEDLNYDLDEPDSFEVISGKGLKAEINDKNYLIGNKKLLEEAHISISNEIDSHKIGTHVYIAQNNILVAYFIIGDEIKPEAKSVIQKLKDRGLKTWIITGDNRLVAEDVAKSIGVDHVIADTLPLHKAEAIEKIQSSGEKVVMVGDGINDAPALAKADLSLAMGTGTDVAISTADVTLVNGELESIVEFLDLSNGTMNIIRQNLFLSLIYNTLLIPIAAGILVVFGGPAMSPILASIAMGLSSISVVSNSLRIRKLI